MSAGLPTFEELKAATDVELADAAAIVQAASMHGLIARILRAAEPILLDELQVALGIAVPGGGALFGLIQPAIKSALDKVIAKLDTK